MKNLKFLAILFTASILFTYCSNVDDDDIGGNEVTETNYGTRESPYSIPEVINMNPTSNAIALHVDVWVKGYIVGYYDRTEYKIEDSAPFTGNINILMAARPNETNKSRYICVELPEGQVRDALGLASHPENLNKEILVYGDIVRYNSFPGVSSTSAYWFVQENIGIDPPTPSAFDVPEISINELIDMWTGSTSTITDEVKIVGIVTTDLIGGNSTSLRNFTITSEDNSAGIQIRAGGNHEYNMGDKIEIALQNVEYTQYASALQLNDVPLIRTRKVGTGTITPHVISISELISNFSNYESTVVTITGTVTSSNANGTWGSSTANQNNIVSKDGSSLTAFVSRYAKFIDTPVPTGEVQITGIAARFNSTYQILIRNLDDIN